MEPARVSEWVAAAGSGAEPRLFRNGGLSRGIRYGQLSCTLAVPEESDPQPPVPQPLRAWTR